MKLSLTLFSLLLLCGSLFSQNLITDYTPGLTLPEVSKKWVDMKSYEPEPEASAVMLFDKGELHFSSLRAKIMLVYHYKRAIKVLDDDAAQEFSTIRIPVNVDEDLMQVIVEHHRRYSRIVKVRIGREMMENIIHADGSKERIIRIPKVVPGSVITFAWSVATDQYTRIRPWHFQHDIPVKESHFVTHVPEDFNMMALLQGEIGSFESKEKRNFGKLYFKSIKNAQLEPTVQAIPKGVGEPAMIRQTDYSMTEISPYQAAPFGNYNADLTARMLFQIQGMEMMNYSNDWTTTWEDFTSFFKRHSRLGNIAKGKVVVKNWLKENGIDVKQKPNKDQLSAISKLVQNTIEWNSGFDVLASTTTRELLRTQVGNSADINLLLASALDALDYKVTLMMTCTRDYGRLMERFPVLAQFNHLILEVRLRGKTTYLDASQPRLPVGLLPLNIICNSAMRINPRKANWVSLDDDLIRHRHTLAFFELDPEQGVINGQLRHLDRGYSALKTQQLLARYEDNMESYFSEEMLAEFPAANMERHIVKTEQRGEEEAISTRVQFVTRDYITQGDSLILVEPLLSESYPVNPFGKPDRSMPIDFGSPVKEEFVLLLTIPEGYEFAVIPESTAVALPHDYGRFLYTYQIVNRTLQLLSRIQIDRGEFPSSYHVTLSEFFDYIAAKHGERVIIRKL